LPIADERGITAMKIDPNLYTGEEMMEIEAI